MWMYVCVGEHHYAKSERLQISFQCPPLSLNHWDLRNKQVRFLEIHCLFNSLMEDVCPHHVCKHNVCGPLQESTFQWGVGWGADSTGV